MNFKLDTLDSGRNRRFFVPCDLEIWQMILKNKGAFLLNYVKLCASFQSHWWIQTGVTVQKPTISVKMSGNAQFGSKSMTFLSHVALKFDGWSWKTMEHLCYANSSFVHHFVTNDEFKLKLESGNTIPLSSAKPPSSKLDFERVNCMPGPHFIELFVFVSFADTEHIFR